MASRRFLDQLVVWVPAIVKNRKQCIEVIWIRVQPGVYMLWLDIDDGAVVPLGRNLLFALDPKLTPMSSPKYSKPRLMRWMPSSTC